MNESVKKFKEDIEQIKVPARDLKTAIHIGINRVPSQRKRLSRRVVYITSAAVLLISLLLGSGFVSPAMAKMLSEIPYIGSVLPYSDKGLKAAEEKGLIQRLGITVVDAGIPITVTDIYYDHNRLEIGYYIPIEQLEVLNIEEINFIGLGIEAYEIKLDDKEPEITGTSEKYKEDYVTGTIYVRDKQISKNPRIRLSITEVLETKGEWIFEFEVERIEDLSEFEINNSVKSGAATFTIESIEVTPSATKVFYEIQAPKNSIEPFAIEYKLINLDGKEMEPLKYGMVFYEHTETETIMRSELFFEPLENINEEVTILPTNESEVDKMQSITLLIKKKSE